MNKKIHNLEFTADLSSLTKTLDTENGIIIRKILANDNLQNSVRFIGDLGKMPVREIPFVSQTWTRKGGTCSTFANGGTVSHSPITLRGVYVHYEQSVCLDDMRTYFYGPYAGPDVMDPSVPFEADFMAQAYDFVGQDLSLLFWQGGTLTNGEVVTSMISKAVTAGATQLATQSFAVGYGLTTSGIALTFDVMASSLDPNLYTEKDLTLYVGTAEFLRYLQTIKNVNNINIDGKSSLITGTYLYNHPHIWIQPQIGLSGTGKALLTKKDYVIFGSDVNPSFKQFDAHYDFASDTTMYRYKTIFASAIAPAGSGIVVASSSGSF